MNLNARPIQKAEKKAFEMLGAQLEAGENLLEFCQAVYAPGLLSFSTQQFFFIGLTQRRLILINPRKKDKVCSIEFAWITHIITGNPAKNKAELTLGLTLRPLPGNATGQTLLKFSALTIWAEHAQRMVEQFTATRQAWEGSPALLTIPQAVELVKSMQAASLGKEAQALFKDRFDSDAYFSSDPGVQALQRTIVDGKLAMRVAAVVFGIVVLFLLWLAVQGQATVGFGIALAVIAIFNLLRGDPAARGTALGLALLTAVLNAFLGAANNSWIDLLIWAAFGISMSLLLIGTPGRLRIAIGAGSFAIGSVGLLLFFALAMQVAPESAQGLAPQPTGPFVEDFSALHQWSVLNNDQAAANWENGAYYLTIKKPQVIYYSFPPITFFPVQAEVEAWAPRGDSDKNQGLFGLTCRYQEKANKAYLVYINPVNQNYVVVRVEGQQETPLTNPVLQPAKGLKADKLPNRIALSCQDNKITLTINGIEQPPVEDPQMANFGTGRMGLMAAAMSPDAAQGYKVLFDNAKFWPAK